MEITKRVAVTIAEEELVGLVVKALYPPAMETMGRERTLYRALAHLVGLTDVEAVKEANYLAKHSPGGTAITTDDFRKWLPQVLSKAFAKLLGGEKV